MTVPDSSFSCLTWCARWDSNPQPTAYEAAALTGWATGTKEETRWLGLRIIIQF